MSYDNYQSLQLRLIGKNAIILHNGQTADPRNVYAKKIKEISSKRKKVDADYDQMALIEFTAGFYQSVDRQTGVKDLVLTDYVLEANMVAGAKKSKSGTQAKFSVFAKKHASLEFPGKPEVINDETIEKLFWDGNHHLSQAVKVGMSKVIRTRPCIYDWSCVVDLEFDEEFVNRDQVIGFFRDAGRQVGLCDWRPKYGRYEVEVVD